MAGLPCRSFRRSRAGGPLLVVATRKDPTALGAPDRAWNAPEREDRVNEANVARWAIALSIVVTAWLVGWSAERLLLGRLIRLLRHTPTDLDEILVSALRPHVPLWFLVLGTVLAVHYGQPGESAIHLVEKAGVAVLLLSLTLATSSFLTRVVETRAKRWPDTMPATTLTQNVVRIAVLALGALVVLGNLGIAIAPLITALGVGSLAVALALQPTLSNLFAGLYITLARQIRIGDFVELETGHQGYVVDVGWRSTQIRELPDNVVIIPNARLAEVIVKNYALPSPPQAALVQVGVAYGSDLEQVELVTLETAREVQRTVPGADAEFVPFLRFNSFGDSAIGFTVILRVNQFVDRYLVTHEFMKRLHLSYSRVGIEIPFPQRVVHLREAPEGQAK